MTGLALGYLPEIKQVHFVISELIKAKEKHPEFPDNHAEAGMIIAEEKAELDCAWDQFCKTVNDRKNKDHLREEAAHVAVTAIRFLEMLEK
jgi:hypothetical protein